MIGIILVIQIAGLFKRYKISSDKRSQGVMVLRSLMIKRYYLVFVYQFELMN